jgi:cytochrome c oxidase cbb3-type subunit 3
MPPFAEALDQAQIEALANYVYSMSGGKADQVKAAQGKELFHSDTAACFYCHGDDAKGRQDIGSANLTDKVWLWADVFGLADDVAKINAIKTVIAGGLNKGVMPAWEGRLNAEQIKLLTVYVHELGGGK